MPETNQGKRILLDVKKMNEAEQDAAIDSALDMLFGKEESQTKKPVRRKGRPSQTEKKAADEQAAPDRNSR